MKLKRLSSFAVISLATLSATAELHAVPILYGGIGRGSSANPGSLITVDQSTGAGTLVGDPITPGGLTGLDFDSSGALWGSSIDGPLGNRVSDLVRIDPTTGSLLTSVPILRSGVPISIGDLAVQPGTDFIFGIGSNSDATSNTGGRLFTINPITGVATLVGDTAQGRSGGLAFAPDGTLFFLEFGELHVLDPSSGQILSTTLLDFAGHDGLGIRPSDGVLFATGAGAGSLGDEIRVVDPLAATSTLIGRTGVGGASDLAFLQTVPDSANTALCLIIGMIGSVAVKWRTSRKTS